MSADIETRNPVAKLLLSTKLALKVVLTLKNTFCDPSFCTAHIETECTHHVDSPVLLYTFYTVTVKKYAFSNNIETFELI